MDRECEWSVQKYTVLSFVKSFKVIFFFTLTKSSESKIFNFGIWKGWECKKRMSSHFFLMEFIHK